jgi:hypothetical protein
VSVDPTATARGTPEGAGISIHISIEKTEPLTGVAATEGRAPLPFVGWLELLRVVSDLIGAGIGAWRRLPPP